MAKRNWQHGTGRYVGNDKGTYVVVDDDGAAFLVVIAHEPLGYSGNLYAARTADGLMVRARGRRLGEDESQDLLLVDGLTGYWDVNSERVFCDNYDEPKPVVAPEKKTKKKLAEPEPAAAEEAAEEPAEVPNTAAATARRQPLPLPQREPRQVIRYGAFLPTVVGELVSAVQREYSVYRGTGGVTAFIREDGHVVLGTHTQITSMVGSRIPDPTERPAFWKALRYNDGVRELTEVTVNRSPDGYPSDKLGLDGWYWCEPGAEPVYILSHNAYALIQIVVQQARGCELAVNGSLALPTGWVGYIGPNKVYPRVNNKSELTVLTGCAMGRTSTFDAVLTTAIGPRVIRFSVRREGIRTVFDPIRITRPSYLVATDQKGRVRVFMHP